MDKNKVASIILAAFLIVLFNLLIQPQVPVGKDEIGKE